MLNKSKSWVAIAEVVLREAPRPLTARQIADRAYAMGLKVYFGQALGEAVKTAIRKDLKHRGPSSPFEVVKVKGEHLFCMKELERLHSREMPSARARL